MAEAKNKETKKKAVKKTSKLKITKSNGKVIYRDITEGIKESYLAKGYKVEEE